MSQSVLLNGVVYTIPDTGDENWGENLTDYFIAIPQSVLQKTGGAFTLTADVNFGANYGLVSKYIKSRTADPASLGVLRLSNSDSIAFRNAANDGNLELTVDSSNRLLFNGVVLQPAGNYITSLTGDVVATGPGAAASTIQAGVIDNAKVSASAGIAYSKLNLTSGVVNADISGSAAIDFSKLASLTSGNVLVGSAGNVPTSVAMSGDVTISNAGVTAIGANKVANSQAAQMAAHTFKGNNTGSTANALDLTIAQMSAELGVSTATASTLMGRDSNANSRANNLIEGFTTTATAAGTTTLTVSSTYTQQFTGSTTQTVVLPDCTTLVLGQQFSILNRSSGTVTVNANGGGLIQLVAASAQVIVTCTSVGSAAGSWDANYSAPSGTGTVTSVTFTGDNVLLSNTPSAAVTTSGTLTASLKTQTANRVLAGPTSGGAANPTFRALVAADLPSKIIALYTSTGNQTLANNTPTVFIWDTLVLDAGTDMNTSTGVYTVPRTAVYTISANVYGQQTANIEYRTDLRKNGTVVYTSITSGNSGSNSGFQITATIQATLNDTIDIRLTQTGAGYDPNAGVTVNFLSIVQVE